jgi:hypothetical protein
MGSKMEALKSEFIFQRLLMKSLHVLNSAFVFLAEGSAFEYDGAKSGGWRIRHARGGLLRRRELPA